MKSRFVAIFFLCAAMPITTGCDRIDTYVENLVDKLLAEKINTRIETLEKHVSEVEGNQFDLFSRVSALEGSSATITTESTSYGIARTQFGSFIVSCRNATPYLDGFKVKIWIGNLTEATFKDVVVTANWGLPYDRNNLKAFIDSQKKKEVSFIKTFSPGKYTEIELVLTPAKPEEIKKFEIAVKFDQLSLISPR